MNSEDYVSLLNEEHMKRLVYFFSPTIAQNGYQCSVHWGNRFTNGYGSTKAAAKQDAAKQMLIEAGILTSVFLTPNVVRC